MSRKIDKELLMDNGPELKEDVLGFDVLGVSNQLLNMQSKLAQLQTEINAVTEEEDSAFKTHGIVFDERMTEQTLASCQSNAEGYPDRQSMWTRMWATSSSQRESQRDERVFPLEHFPKSMFPLLSHILHSIFYKTKHHTLHSTF